MKIQWNFSLKPAIISETKEKVDLRMNPTEVSGILTFSNRILLENLNFKAIFGDFHLFSYSISKLLKNLHRVLRNMDVI